MGRREVVRVCDMTMVEKTVDWPCSSSSCPSSIDIPIGRVAVWRSWVEEADNYLICVYRIKYVLQNTEVSASDVVLYSQNSNPLSIILIPSSPCSNKPHKRLNLAPQLLSSALLLSSTHSKKRGLGV